MGDHVGGASPHEPGLLYIIQEGKSNYYKVGSSKNQNTLMSRLKNLQSGNWRELTIKQDSEVSDMNSAEQYAHYLLEDYHVEKGGGQEWFNGPLATIESAVDEAANEYPRKWGALS